MQKEEKQQREAETKTWIRSCHMGGRFLPISGSLIVGFRHFYLKGPKGGGELR